MTDLVDLSRRPAPFAKPDKITAPMVKAALRARFAQPEWAILFEVGDATGARHTRFADAVAMSLWPSRGLDLHGMEIKVSKYDWQHERQHPEKAETIAAYCDFWWLVTGPGVVQRREEIPTAWGWLEYDGTRLVTIKEPARTEAKTCDRKFLAALLRRAHKTDQAMIDAEMARREEQREAAFDARVKQQAEYLVHDRGELRKAVEAFEKASGISISDSRLGYWAHDAEKVGKAVRLVRDLRLAQDGYGSLIDAFSALQDKLGAMQKVMVEAGLMPALAAEQVPPKKRKRAP